MIKENKNKILLILLTVFLIAGWFYWFQWKPDSIRKSCAEEAIRRYNGRYYGTATITVENNSYRLCLVKNRIKPESLFVK